MAEPTAFISHFKIKPAGGLRGFRALTRELTPLLEAQKPGTLAFLIFANEATNRLTIIHVFGDAEAMDRHFEGSAERASDAFEYIEPAGWELYGPVTEQALAAIRAAGASAGVSVTVARDFVAGFLRLAPG